MSMDYTYELIGEKSIRFFGVQFRNESPDKIWDIVSQNKQENLVSVKIPSGKVWSGVGQPFRYEPPEIVVFRLNPTKKTAMSILNISLGRSKVR